MTPDQQKSISAQIQAWRDCGQHEHAEALRAQMWAIIKPFMTTQ